MPANSKKILVTGGTGFLGSYLLRYLLQKGIELTSLRRSSSPMKMVADIEDQIRWVEGDLTDIQSLENALQDIDQVFHVAAMVSMDPRKEQEMLRINQKGTANLVNLSLDLGIQRLLHVSSVAVFGNPGKSGLIDEGEPWAEFEPLTAYGRTKYQAELEVWRAMAEGLNAVIINPSTILGSGDWDDPSLAFFRMGHTGTRFYPKGTGGFVDVRDVVQFMIKLMDSDIQQERFIVNSENISYREVMGQIAMAFGKQPPHIQIGKGIQRVYSWWDGLSARLNGHSQIVTSDTVRTAGHHTLYQNEKGVEALDFIYRPVTQTLWETCQHYERSASNQFEFYPLQLD